MSPDSADPSRDPTQIPPKSEVYALRSHGACAGRASSDVRAFATWLNPGSLVQWMLSGYVTNTSVEAAARVGGAFRIVMEHGGSGGRALGRVRNHRSAVKGGVAPGWVGGHRAEDGGEFGFLS